MATDLHDILEKILDAQSHLVMRHAELERRIDNSIRHGKVTDVDAAKQLARIEIGERDGKPVKSAWVPYGQLAGDYKSHRPPTKGQQMTMFAPNGEHRQALLMPMTFSDDNKSPSDKADEHVTTFGKLKITEKGDSYTIAVGNSSIVMTDGKIVLKSAQIVTDGETHVGGEGGVPASKQGTIDSNDGVDQRNLATKVFVT